MARRYVLLLGVVVIMALLSIVYNATPPPIPVPHADTTKQPSAAAPAGSIPLVLHRTWRTAQLPGWADGPTNSWRTLNPQMQFITHTDEDTAELVRTRFPQLLPAFEKMIPIEKADLLRYLVVYEFGGYYAGPKPHAAPLIHSIPPTHAAPLIHSIPPHRQQS